MTRTAAKGAAPAAALAPAIQQVADDAYAWQLDRHWYFRLRGGQPVERLADGGAEAVAADAAVAARLVAAADRAQPYAATVDDRDTLAYVRALAGRVAVLARHRMLLPPVTPYRLSDLTIAADLVLAQHAFVDAADADRFAALTGDLARALRAVAATLAAQAARGVRLPAVALPGVDATLAALPQSLRGAVVPGPVRLRRLGGAGARRAAEVAARAYDDDIVPAVNAIRAVLDDDYRDRSPDGVGLHQYPGGTAAYHDLIGIEAAEPADPDALHRLGVDECKRLAERMRDVRARLGHRGDEDDFHKGLARTRHLYAATPDDVAARLERYVARIEARVAAKFAVLPTTPYGVARLDPALEGGLTFGYYEPATRAQPVGLYRYNGSNLPTRSMLTMAAVIYHELIPGHHFHVARQSENTALHPLRRDGFFDVAPAYMEGWAEYAADLGWDLGAYDDPWDAYGRLAQERLTATRLVVDTAMNTGRWTLERAREFMRRNIIDTEPQIRSESLRYSTDVPAQALAYRTGYLAFTSLRARTEARLAGAFSEQRFHEWVIGCGTLPLPALATRVDRLAADATTPTTGR